MSYSAKLYTSILIYDESKLFSVIGWINSTKLIAKVDFFQKTYISIYWTGRNKMKHWRFNEMFYTNITEGRTIWKNVLKYKRCIAVMAVITVGLVFTFKKMWSCCMANSVAGKTVSSFWLKLLILVLLSVGLISYSLLKTGFLKILAPYF